MPFTQLGLHPDLVRGVEALGFSRPTPIQEQAIPPAMQGRDLLACAMTGSGKTAAFVLPILSRLHGKPRGTTRALVLTPTRELAAQIDEHLNALAAYVPLSSTPIFGGVGLRPQEQALRRGIDVVVATPGRLLDHMRSRNARLQGLEILVLDEADRMLDMGFLPDIKRILAQLPTARQTLFFSATLPPPIVGLARQMLKDPVTIQLERQPTPPAAIEQAAYPVSSGLKSKLLVELLQRGTIRSVIVFTRTKHRANRLADYLGRQGLATGRLHGNRSQTQRTQALADFKAGRFPVLVATDIAARGIDVDALSHVVNYDVPNNPEDYVHRIGRTGRAEAVGAAFMFVSPEDESDLRAIEKVIGRRLARVTLPGFDYAQANDDTQAARHFERPMVARGHKRRTTPFAGRGHARPDSRRAGARTHTRSGRQA